MASQKDDARDERAPLALDSEPVTNCYQIAIQMVARVIQSLAELAESGGATFRVATMCSGTEAPIWAFNLLMESAEQMLGNPILKINHVFSAEIEPFKQSFILRNTNGTVPVFRDVTDLGAKDAHEAFTAEGTYIRIPGDVDILIAGTSCRSFSNLNTAKKSNFPVSTKLCDEWKTYFVARNKMEKQFMKEREAREKDAKKAAEGAAKAAKKSGRQAKIDQTGKIDLSDVTDQHETDREKADAVVEQLPQNFWERARDAIRDMANPNLNSELDQSTKTFFGMVGYCLNKGPKIILLENVQGAPWDEICEIWLPAAGYVATYLYLDTKDYYIPHTRARGYAIAVHCETFGLAKAKAILKAWRLILPRLKAYPSSPVSEWLLQNNDPMAIKARQDESELAMRLKKEKDSSWSRSELRHYRERRDNELGEDAPMTAWNNYMTVAPYDRFDRLTKRLLSQRALDCIDILYLLFRKGKKSEKKRKKPEAPYDIKFKLVCVDVSQNIDRLVTQAFHPGITGCLTPRGLVFMTDSCRLVSGFEVLSLQGMPLRDLDLTRESQDQLRDLAGNAMSVSVVAAAELATVIAVFKAFKGQVSPIAKIPVEDRIRMVDSEPLSWSNSDQKSIVAKTDFRQDHSSLRKVFRESRRYCFCGGIAQYSKAELYQCEFCQAIRCKSCYGNPTHKFSPYTRAEQGVTMYDTVPQEVMRYMPTSLSDIMASGLSKQDFFHRAETPQGELEHCVSEIFNALLAATFLYHSVSVTEVLKITYFAQTKSSSFRLECIIRDHDLTWNLYLYPWCDSAKTLRELMELKPRDLEHPFARLRIDAKESQYIPHVAVWELWVYQVMTTKIRLQSSDNQAIILSTIKGKNFNSLPTPVQKSILSIVGRYDPHPECDTAEDSLHVKDGKALFLFKDPVRYRSANDDYFVISDDCRYLESHERRDVVVEFPSSWAPMTSIKRNPVVPTRGAFQIWGPAKDTKTLAAAAMYRFIDPDAALTLSRYYPTPKSEWAIVPARDQVRVCRVLAPITVRLAAMDYSSLEIPTKPMVSIECLDQYMVLPPIHWLNTTGESDIKSGTRRCVAHRLASDMKMYMEQTKKRKSALDMHIKIKSDGVGYRIGRDATISVHIGINSEALMHEAVARLVLSGVGEEFNGTLAASMRVVTGHSSVSHLKFKSFKSALKPLQKSRYHNVSLDTVWFLSQHQKISVTWMYKQEMDPGTFEERAVEEHILGPLNLRLVGTARRENKRRGGILADQVGYGKTVISLALMKLQEKFDATDSIQERDTDDLNTIALKCSLVVVPKHLVDQWRKEIEGFLQWFDYTKKDEEVEKAQGVKAVIIVKTASELLSIMGGKLLDRLKKAKVLIVSEAVFNQEYFNALAKVGGGKNPPERPLDGKVANESDLACLRDWYNDIVPYARKFACGFDPTRFIGSKHADMLQRVADVTRKHGSALFDYKTLLGVSKPDTGKEAQPDPSEEQQPKPSEVPQPEAASATDILENEESKLHVLEAFSFARIILDEFSYENPLTSMFVANCHAYSTWVLSATAPTGSLGAVCDIANLLKVYVAPRADARPGHPRITHNPGLQSDEETEKQLAFSRYYSDQCVQERMSQGYKFLEHFASSNFFDEEGLGRIDYTEMVEVCRPTRGELTGYLAMQRAVQDADLEPSELSGYKTLANDLPADVAGWSAAGLLLALHASCYVGNHGANIRKLLLKRQGSLKESQMHLKFFIDLTIFLIYRLNVDFKNPKAKINESAKSIVIDMACWFRCIQKQDHEVFGGPDGLASVTQALFPHGFNPSDFPARDPADTCDTVLWDWLNADYREATNAAQPFQRHAAWATYFQIPDDDLVDLDRTELEFALKDLERADRGLFSLENAHLFDKLEEETTALIQGNPPTARLQSHLKLLLSLFPKYSRTDGVFKTGFDHGVEEPSQSEEGNANTKKGKQDEHDPYKYPRLDQKKVTVRGGKFTEAEAALTDVKLVLGKATTRIINNTREVCALQAIFDDKAQPECSVCGATDPSMRFVSECGHFLCAGHLSKHTHCGHITTDQYPHGNGCKSLIRDRTILAAQLRRCADKSEMPTSHTMGDTTPLSDNDFFRAMKGDLFVETVPTDDEEDQPQPTPPSSPSNETPVLLSSKSIAIANKVEHISKILNERVLVFYQFKRQADELVVAFERRGIPYRHLTSQDDKEDKRIKELNKGLNKDQKDKLNHNLTSVRLIRINHKEAAGSNLQDANHVIMASAFVFSKQEDWESFVKQAKGRALRHGQQKMVQIYWFVTAMTFEVDLLQKRLQKRIHLPMGKQTAVLSEGVGKAAMENPEDCEDIMSSLPDTDVWRLTNEFDWLVTNQ
ncbi:hypothetical protein F5Y16DRAFT_422225 [Xylariaceae sp. FL0255]|nr:hypothetical protein F5Y16DRAFT_422225 [Xylariaceae sp. FL0255]